MNAYEIIRRPQVTEKTVHLQNEFNTYTFEVHPDANKAEIKKAVESLWKVTVVTVNTQNYRGKWKKMRSKQPGLTRRWKRAFIKLEAGQKIEGV